MTEPSRAPEFFPIFPLSLGQRKLWKGGEFEDYLDTENTGGEFLLQIVCSVTFGKVLSQNDVFFIPLVREEKRKVFFGYFDQENQRSVWSLLGSDEEFENTENAAKWVRKMRSVLSKCFPDEKFDLLRVSFGGYKPQRELRFEKGLVV